MSSVVSLAEYRTKRTVHQRAVALKAIIQAAGILSGLTENDARVALLLEDCAALLLQDAAGRSEVLEVPSVQEP